jgi:hypothetical protein
MQNSVFKDLDNGVSGVGGGFGLMVPRATIWCILRACQGPAECGGFWKGAACVRLGNILDFGSLGWYVPGITKDIIWLCWCGVLELVRCGGNIAGHGDVNVLLQIVPMDDEAAI